jgi:K+-sensing histidine kinase KdpD
MAVEKTFTGAKTQEKILLVDDDAAFLKVAQGILHAKGYAVDTVAIAADAINAFKKSAYSLVILDMMLPDKTGIELLTDLNRIQPDVISVILTGYSSVENSVKSLNLGAFAYLEKPIRPDALLDVIHRGLEKRQLLVENRRLLKELEQRNRDLNVLLSISQTITTSLNPEHIVNSALGIVAQSLGLDGGYFLRYQKNASIYDGYFGFSTKWMEQLKHIELRETVLKTVFRQNDPVVINRLKETDDPLLSSLVKGGYRSLLAVPVALTKESDGVLFIVTVNEHIFSPLEVNLLKAVGREVSIVITNSQLLEEASSAKALRELDAMRTELLANVSHELRTPLAAIKGFASSLLQPDISFDDETRQSFIQTIDNEANRLSHLIDDLLLMSRIEAGVFKVKKELFEFSEIIGAIKDRLHSIAIKHNLRLIVPDTLPPLMVDGPRIGEVVTNLVENAVKYSPEASEITIEVEQRDGSILTHVTDKGIGIPKEYQPMVFDRFNQLASKNGQRKGSGLGLCICRGIVEAHKGKVWVESEPGKGARFSFSLPINTEY